MEYRAVDASSSRAGSSIRVRDAQPGELDMVSSLLAEVYGEFRPHFPADAWERYLGEIVDVRSRLADSELIVAEDNGRLVGTVSLYPDATRSALERLPVGWTSIRALAVQSDARGRGIGEALARECLRRTRQRRARAVGLHTNPFMDAATRLYERLGFRRVPEFDIEIGVMFTGRTLPPDARWQVKAFRFDLEGWR